MTRSVDILFRVVRGGADFGEIYAMGNSTPRLRTSCNGSIHMSLSGDFADPGDSVDWSTDMIKPMLIIDGVEHSLGLLYVTTVQQVINEFTRYVHIEAFDQCWFLKNYQTESLLYYATADRYTPVISTLLSNAGIGSARITPNLTLFGTAREDWKIGTDYLTIINELLEEINYSPIWFDAEGTAVIEPMPNPESGNIRHVLDEKDVKSLLIPEMSVNSDFYSTPNVFKLICSSPDRSTPLIATATNTDGSSPISVPRRGRKIMKTIYVNNIGSQQDLQDMADRMCRDTLIRTERISIKTGLLYGFELNELVALNFAGESSICIEKGWTMDLKPGGIMTHNMERMVSAVG